jgi:hypothetical protein
MVRVSKATHDNLVLLRMAWEKGSLDEVIEELVQPWRLEKLKAIGFHIPEELREVRAED